MLLDAELTLSSKDNLLGELIGTASERWPCSPREDPIWGLVRIVMAQQISTHVACRLAQGVKSAHPSITAPSPQSVPTLAELRTFGLSERRAQCCVNILQRSEEIREKIRGGETWE